MRTAMNSVLGSTSNAMISRQRPMSRSARRDQLIQDRLAERQREMQKQKKEKERINNIKARMSDIMADEDLSRDIQRHKITSLTGQIAQIYESREHRQALAAEREASRQHEVLSELMQPEERPQNNLLYKIQCPDEAEEEEQNNKIANVTRFAAARDSITLKARTRAVLAAEAGQLRRALESPNSNTVKVGIIGSERKIQPDAGIIISSHTGFGGNDFRNTHYANLKRGIAGLDIAINSTISNIYRDSMKTQEEHISKQDDDKESETNYEI